MVDVLLDDNSELQVRDGDFVMGNDVNQRIGLIVRIRQGSLKQSPLCGYGEQRFLNGPFDGASRREIQLQLESDGIRVKQMEVVNERLYINGE